ncbi:MAG: four helix bundle protein [Ferruginibacter sp.]
MEAGNKNIVVSKSYLFALEIVKVYKYLTNERKEYVLSKQLLRSGTSIGANINEAIASSTKRDFVYKFSLSLKEARETLYWLNLLFDSNYILSEQFELLRKLCDELVKIISSIILTTKQKYFNANS